MLKVKDMRKMNRKALHAELESLKKELFRIRAKKTAGVAPENPGIVKQIRRTIARIKTVLREVR